MRRVIIRFTFKKSSGTYVGMVDREKNREIIWVSHFKNIYLVTPSLSYSMFLIETQTVSHGMWDLVPPIRIKPGPLGYWECGVLVTEPPAKSPVSLVVVRDKNVALLGWSWGSWKEGIDQTHELLICNRLGEEGQRGFFC